MQVCPASLAAGPVLAAKCDKVKLAMGRRQVVPVTAGLPEEALAYTTRARLGPTWNRVGEWLLAGRQFLHQADHLPAAKLRLHLADTRVEFVIAAAQVTFPLLEPWDLGISDHALEDFVVGAEARLGVEDFGRQQVLVLPRLSSATLLGVSKLLPRGSRFGEWAAMKRYWKNMYGYRLEQEDGSGPTVYYDVAFRGGATLTYIGLGYARAAAPARTPVVTGRLHSKDLSTDSGYCTPGR